MALVRLSVSVAALSVESLSTSGSACAGGEVPWPVVGTDNVTCEPFGEATAAATQFLDENMPPWDVINRGTLDEYGIVPVTVNLSLTVRQLYPWAAVVPKDIWEDSVLPYANVNEGRNDWRQLFFDTLSPLVAGSEFDGANLSYVATFLNDRIWAALRPNQSKVTFKGGSTPLVYDPMSTLVFGYASCTGVSILYVDALRSLGIPARIAGTPAWHGNEDDGNHNWVEVWLGEGQGLAGEAWSFIEGRPAGGGEFFSNPCDKWFCNPSHFDDKTQVYSARFSQQGNTTYYPMIWDPANHNVPGENRSSWYNSLCQPCGTVQVTLV